MFCGLGLTASLKLPGADAPSEADGAVAFATGRYRNLFAEIGKSQAEIREKVDAAFQQLFHGNPTNEAVYYEAGTNSNGSLAFVTERYYEGLLYMMALLHCSGEFRI